MRHLLLASAAFLALANVASAADISINEPAPVAPAAPATFDWNGFYAGVHGGFGWGRGTKDADFLDSVSGGLFGVQAGYNYQVNPWLVGFETDIAYSGLSDNAGDVALDLNWLGSTTARIGFTYDKWLFYGKGGIAYGDVEAKVAGVGSDSKWAVGWTAGAGVEYGFTPNLTGRLEYDYVDLGSKTVLDGTPAQADVGITSNAVKAGLNYKF
ncbi:membrane protein [Kaistia sp. 32K]|uniref:outer membrane protein n=1 Tax=Kaistia sp. 32K TaxID=2795690 RepID=UPI001915851A|nr:outer membrane protein [Kaistia sp. 32K]BCP51658.1 membrane protein [Kaistia sp. 32K]